MPEIALGRDPTRHELLSAHFFRRMFDNDLISPNGDGHEHLASILALTAVPGLFVSVFLTLKYLSPFASPGQRMLFSLPDKSLFLGCAFLVMALVTVLEWDALSLDGRDHAVLGSLPIPRGLMVRAKLAALGKFVALFGVAINAAPVLIYPWIMVATLPIGFGRAFWLLGAQVVASMAASAFGFLLVLTLRETLRVLLGDRVFRRFSTPLQFACVVILVGALLLLPAVPPRIVRDALAAGGPAAFAWPPLWFAGLFETLTAGAILGAPGIDVPTKWQFWTERQHQAYTRAYLAQVPVFHALATLAILAIGLCALAGLGAFAMTSRRSTEPAAVRPGRLRRFMSTAMRRSMSRNPVVQAAFSFTLQTFLRSAEHRVYFAGYVAAGCGIAIVLLGAPIVRAVLGGAPPQRDAVLPVQMVLSFFVLAGLRATFARPAALRANWIFQVSWPGRTRRYYSGVRRAVALLLAVPFAALLPMHVWWFGLRVAGAHAVAGWLAALMAAELIMPPAHRVPFATPHEPGRENLKAWWPAYLLAFIMYTSGFAWLESVAFARVHGARTLVLTLAALLLAAAGSRRWRERRLEPMAFEEELEPETQPLGLSS